MQTFKAVFAACAVAGLFVVPQVSHADRCDDVYERACSVANGSQGEHSHQGECAKLLFLETDPIPQGCR